MLEASEYPIGKGWEYINNGRHDGMALDSSCQTDTPTHFLAKNRGDLVLPRLSLFPRTKLYPSNNELQAVESRYGPSSS